MMKEPAEKRVFLPEFIQFLAELGVAIYLEEGYGSRSGFMFGDYKQGHKAVKQCSRQEAFQQDITIVLRSPTRDEFSFIRRGACLISMLHYPTRPVRVEILRDLGIQAISLDSITNEQNIRLVENMKAVAWNGLEAAYDHLEKRWPGLVRPDGEPIRVFVLGTGMVGKYAVDAAVKLGNIERYNQHIQDRGLGALALAVGRSVSQSPLQMEKLMRECDILVDASQRRDASRPLIPNDWLAWLPEHAIVIDLAVDPYSLDANPPVVRGVEGIPQGNLSQYVFTADDPAWDLTIPAHIPSKHRRSVVSCYSWPGIHPEACMLHYARQMEPLMEVLIRKGYDGLKPTGEYFERALYRATLKAWLGE
jgi:alanine dehydrogenase